MLKLWPYIVQFSYVIYDTILNDIVLSSDAIIRLQDEIIIPEDSIKIHGITNEISQKNGINIHLILNDFFRNLRDIDLLVGHNVSFDINMIKVELLRLIYESNSISENEVNVYKYNLDFLTNYKNIFCTLQESIDLCDIKAIDKFGKKYTKFPKLLELHQKLFDSKPNNLHNSFNDILVTLRCFMKLKNNIDLNEKCDKFIQIAKDIQLL